MPFDAETYVAPKPAPNPLAPKFQKRALRMADAIRNAAPHEYYWSDVERCVYGWALRTSWYARLIGPRRYLGFTRWQAEAVFWNGKYGVWTRDGAIAFLERYAATGRCAAAIDN